MSEGITTDDLDVVLQEVGLVVHDVQENDKSLARGMREIRELILGLVRSKRRPDEAKSEG